MARHLLQIAVVLVSTVFVAGAYADHNDRPHRDRDNRHDRDKNHDRNDRRGRDRHHDHSYGHNSRGHRDHKGRVVIRDGGRIVYQSGGRHGYRLEYRLDSGDWRVRPKRGHRSGYSGGHHRQGYRHLRGHNDVSRYRHAPSHRHGHYQHSHLHDRGHHRHDGHHHSRRGHRW